MAYRRLVAVSDRSALTTVSIGTASASCPCGVQLSVAVCAVETGADAVDDEAPVGVPVGTAAVAVPEAVAVPVPVADPVPDTDAVLRPGPLTATDPLLEHP